MQVRRYTLVSGDDRFDIGSEHVTFVEGLPGSVFSAPMQDATVYVDTALTPELEAEGNAREVIRRIQEMRRQLDLNVEDFISSYVVINDPTNLRTGQFEVEGRDHGRSQGKTD